MTRKEIINAPMVKFIVSALRLLFGEERLINLYLQWVSLVNYAIVCGIGVGINMVVIHALIKIFPLWLANLCAIFTAFLWNWSMSVGPYGWLWGLSSRPHPLRRRKEKIEREGEGGGPAEQACGDA